VEKPDLNRVEEVGFTDLMRGVGTPACSRVDWIEVYGVKRAAYFGVLRRTSAAR